jgi:hypothetical protein
MNGRRGEAFGKTSPLRPEEVEAFALTDQPATRR